MKARLLLLHLIPILMTATPGNPTLAAGNPQPAIIGTAGASNQAIVFSDPGNAPANQIVVPGLPSNALPHGVAYFGADKALVSDVNNSRIFVVQVSTGTLISTINTSSAGYTGGGTIAVAPNLTSALAMVGSRLFAIQAPFNASSTITLATLPGDIQVAQTQAIVFNSAGRAFVYHRTGISVLDAPYTSVAFTIPGGANSSGAIAISPDGKTLLTTDAFSTKVRIFQAPFTTSSTPTLLSIPDGSFLDGIIVTPDGSKAIVVSSLGRRVAAISAPFTSTSTVESLPLPTGGGNAGFEDIGISADGQLVILTGNGSSSADLPVLIKAPFTAAGATSSLLPIQGVANPGRGSGAVRFAKPSALLGNISTRLRVETGDNVLFGGFIVTGTEPKRLIVRAIGPTLSGSGVPDALQNPTLELYRGQTLIASNDNWVEASNNQEISDSQLAPKNNVESAILTSLTPGAYTAIVRGVNGGTGVGLVEVYDLGQTPDSKLAQISTRGLVQTGANVMFGGFFVLKGSQEVIIRAIGPSLPVNGKLADPTLELHDSHGTLLEANDNWVDSPNKQAITDTMVAPTNNSESAILRTLVPGPYTAIVRGVNNATGIALVEVYALN